MNNVLRANNRTKRTAKNNNTVKSIETVQEKIEKAVNLFNKDNIVSAFRVTTTSGNINVGSATNKCTTHIALSVTPTLGRKALMKTFGLTMEEVGVGKYVGLAKVAAREMKDIKKYCTDNKDVLVTLISQDMVDDLLEEMKNCDLNDAENVQKIFWDLNVIYRMYQELIIDAAKKAYKVVIKIMLEGYRPMSLQKFNHDFNYAEKTINISQSTKSMVGIELFQDPINEIQEDLADFVKELVTKAFEVEIEMSEEESNRLLGYLGYGPVADLIQTVKHGYAALTGQHQAILEEIRELDEDNEEAIAIENKRYSFGLERLKTLVEQLLDGYTDEDAASIMHLIACTDSNMNFNKKSGNQIAVSLMPEKYLSMILANDAKVKVMGYQIAVDVKLEVGSVVEFSNGVSMDGAVLEFKNEIEYANGLFRIEEFKGKKYAVKDIEFKSKEADYSKRVFSVKQKSFKDIEVIKDSLKEGSTIIVDETGDVKTRDTRIASVKCEFGAECENGNTIETLLNVRGTVTYLNIIESEDYGFTILFELSNVVELEEEEDIMPDIIEDETEIITEGTKEELAADDEIQDMLEENYDEIEEMLEEEDEMEMENLFENFQ